MSLDLFRRAFQALLPTALLAAAWSTQSRPLRAWWTGLGRKRGEASEPGEQPFQRCEDALLRADADGRLVDANDRAVALYGYSRDELLGRHLADLLADAAGSFLPPECQGRPVLLEGAHRRRDGETFPVEVAVWQEGSGPDMRVLVLVRDISARRRDEEALRRSEERLRLAVQGADLFVWDLDVLSGRIAYSDRLPRALGYAPEELDATLASWERLVHPDDLRSLERALREHIRGRTVRLVAEFRILAGTGEWRWLQTRAQGVVRDSRGWALRITGTHLDVTARRQAEAARRESEESFSATFQQAPVGIAHLASSRRWLRVNPKLCEILGYGCRDLTALAYDELIAEEDRQAGVEGLRRLAVGEIPVLHVELRFVRRNGDLIWTEITASVRRDPRGEVLHFIVVIEDVSASKLAEQELREARAKLQLAADIALLGFWEWDPRSRRIYFSPELKRQLGYADHELIDSPEEWKSRLHPDDRGPAVGSLRNFIETPRPSLELEYRLRHRDGGYRWIAARVVPILEDGRVVKLMGTHLDITQRKQAEERARKVVQHDPLTGLPNRALIREFGDLLLASARRDRSHLAVLFVDLDRFKPINDTYGHRIGDEVLKQVARRLVSCVRGEDLVGRMGGDEFVIVLSHIHDDRDASRVARQAVARLAEPCRVEGLDLSVSPSIGISLYPRDGDDLAALIRNADVAMYHAKSQGRNNFQFFTGELNERADEQAALEQRLRDGLEHEEFALYYQPVIDARSFEVAGAEALLRWLPESEQPGPGIFIPVAEAANLIQALGEWGLRRACEQHREWQDAGLPAIPVAVNISGMQFRQREFHATLAGILAETGIDPGQLQLELAETAVTRMPEEAAEALERLKAVGVTLALDGFGTGGSSVTQLGRLKIDRLKVDRALVASLARERTSTAAVEAILAMGRALGLEVTAQGVESDEVLAYLREHPCDYLQGYRVAPPMPAGAFADWYRERRAA